MRERVYMSACVCIVLKNNIQPCAALFVIEFHPYPLAFLAAGHPYPRPRRQIRPPPACGAGCGASAAPPVVVPMRSASAASLLTRRGSAPPAGTPTAALSCRRPSSVARQRSTSGGKLGSPARATRARRCRMSRGRRRNSPRSVW